MSFEEILMLRNLTRRMKLIHSFQRVNLNRDACQNAKESGDKLLGIISTLITMYASPGIRSYCWLWIHSTESNGRVVYFRGLELDIPLLLDLGKKAPFVFIRREALACLITSPSPHLHP